ncbi:MAG: GNAT family N-acetyltransferase [Alphaproteobacteria bacterium]|nr:GNAT family N-acetyltransferase [Alphaproteobacteria bacterium]
MSELTVRADVFKAASLTGADMDDLCYATEEAIKDGIGFQWLAAPAREVLEAYWKGVMLVPERQLFLARLDGTVVGALQLVKPGAHKQTTAFAVRLEGHFVAPFARGHGLAKSLLQLAEEEAIIAGFSVIRCDVRETQTRAIEIYESSGFVRWGLLPKYEQIDGRYVAGHFFYKELTHVWL